MAVYTKKGLIELHLHLDGAIDEDIALRLAGLLGITLPRGAELTKLIRVSDECESLNDFLKCFELPLSLMQTKESIEEAVYLVCEKQRAQGVLYGEIRFAPQLHTSKGLSQREVIEAALAGLRRSSLRANLILCLMRGDDNKALNMETVRLAGEYLVRDGGVVAVDLAGAEALYKTADFLEEFGLADKLNIPFTIHAGEADGAQSVWSAVKYGAKRIGHGVRIYEDEKLIEEIKNRGITLEMCPTSNFQTKAVPDMKNYPLVDYLERGVLVTVNTDDPAIEGTDLNAEYRYLEKELGLTGEQEKILLRNAVNAAFTCDEVKKELLLKLGL